MIVLQANKYDIYTRVSKYVDWIEMKILQNGGMSACGYVLENSFVTENGTGFQDGENIDMKKTRGKLCRSL